MDDVTKPLVQNAASPSQTRAAKKRAKRISEIELNRLRAVLSTRDGRRWVWDHMAALGIFLKWIPKDPYLTAYEQGRRNTGLAVLEAVNELGPEVFLQMQKEYREDAERGF